MMESTSVLVNKLCLRIALGNDQSEDLGVGDIVLGMMYKQISQVFNILFDWRTFSRGGTFITADNRVKAWVILRNYCRMPGSPFLDISEGWRT